MQMPYTRVPTALFVTLSLSPSTMRAPYRPSFCSIEVDSTLPPQMSITVYNTAGKSVACVGIGVTVWLLKESTPAKVACCSCLPFLLAVFALSWRCRLLLLL